MRWLLMRVMVLLPLVALSLHTVGLKKTQSMLLRFMPMPTSPPLSSRSPDQITDEIKQFVHIVRIASAYYQPWANCLKKALVLWSLLREQGIESEVRVGVRKNSPTFEAHAWVERQGAVLNDDANVRDYFATFSHPI